MKKFLSLVIICLFFTVNTAFAAKENLKDKFDKIIEQSSLYKNATIAVSIKKSDKGSVVYERDANKLLHPASTLKMVTIMPEINALGETYLFRTQIFYDNDKNVYIKLGADPYLTSNDLKVMLLKLKEKNIFQIKTIYIDSTIVDGIEWGVGWMWDDDTNRLIPKYSVYNLDQNLIKIQITPTKEGENAKISSPNSATTTIMNYVKTSADKTDVGTARFDWVSPNILYIQGTVSQSVTLEVPVSNPQAYFLTELKKNLKNIGISYEKIQYQQLPEGKIMLTEKVSGIERALIDILQNSKNFVAETTLKVAAQKKTGHQGSTITGIDMVKEYYKNILQSDNKVIEIVDASGVSRNNLVTANFLTDVLVYIKPKEHFELVKSKMATPSVGTLKNRLLEYKDKNQIYAKTGTLSGVSGICGYVESNNKNSYAFSILIQNFTQDVSEAKNLEDELIKAITEIQ